jgi:hypothetical protein
VSTKDGFSPHYRFLTIVMVPGVESLDPGPDYVLTQPAFGLTGLHEVTFPTVAKETSQPGDQEMMSQPRSDDELRWLPLISTLSDTYESRKGKWRFTIFFLSESGKFRPFGSPYFRVSRNESGAGLVTAGFFGKTDVAASASEFLTALGRRTRCNKYQADFMLDLEPGWSLSDGFWNGLAAVGAFSDFSSDDFLHCHLQDADEESVLASFNPTPKGDYVYHHLDVPGGGLELYRDALARAPLDPHLKPVLSPQDREKFIERNRSINPEVHEWSDAMILEAEAHGF